MSAKSHRWTTPVLSVFGRKNRSGEEHKKTFENTSNDEEHRHFDKEE